jgi:hypothetical protein
MAENRNFRSGFYEDKMTTLISLIAALALATIPITLGWRRTVDEAGMARAMGIAQPKKKFDPEKFARQTGTGLAFNQIAYGFLAWVGGGLAGGIFLGVFPAILFEAAGGLLYAGTLSDKRQEFRLKQAKDILRGLGVVGQSESVAIFPILSARFIGANSCVTLIAADLHHDFGLASH